MLKIPTKFHWPFTLFALVVLAGLCISFRLPALHSIAPNDNYVYAYIGHAMLHSEKLYTDLVDNKPPAIYVTYMLAEKIWGYGIPALVYCSALFAIISLIFIFLILNRTHGKLAALIGSVFWVFASTSTALDFVVPNTEFYAGTFVLIAIWAYIEYLHGKENLLWLTGGAMAIAIAYKTNAAFILFAFCLLPLFQLRKNQIRTPLMRFAKIALPAALIGVGIFLYFYSQRRFLDFWEINFLAAKEYVGSLRTNEWANLWSGKLFYNAAFTYVLVFVVFSYGWFILGLIKDFPKRYLPLYLLIFVGSLLMTGSIKEMPHAHYYQNMVPLYCLIAAMFCIEVNAYLRDRLRMKNQWVFLATLLAIPILYAGYLSQINSRGIVASTTSDDDRKLGQLMNTLTTPDESIYQWGWGSQIYFYSQRMAASGIVVNHILYFAPMDIRKRLYDKLAADLVKNKPAFVVFTSWAFRLDQEPWFEPAKPYYQFLGLYGKYAVFEKKGREKPAKQILAQLQIQNENSGLPWENPHLVLFPGFKDTVLLNPGRLYGQPLLPAGDGPEASLINEALLLFSQKQHIKGRELLLQALTINPNNLAALAGMATYNEATGQYFLAMNDYQKLAEKIPHPFTEYYIESQNLLMQQAAVLAPPERQ